MYKRILVPIDGSETSNKALVAALQLARDFSARVRLVHVVEELTYLTGYDQYSGYSDDLVKIMRETGAKVLSDAMTIAKAAGVEVDNVQFDTLGERLGETVADAARRWNADLIVVGTMDGAASAVCSWAAVPSRSSAWHPCQCWWYARRTARA